MTCDAIEEARRSGGFLLFAYVLMPEHLHVVTDSRKESKEGGLASFSFLRDGRRGKPRRSAFAASRLILNVAKADREGGR